MCIIGFRWFQTINWRFFCGRERDRQNQRLELWYRVESLAAQRPEYEVIKSKHPEMIGFINSPEPADDEVTFENIEHEAQEVTLLL